jgi:hypothetical protein
MSLLEHPKAQALLAEAEVSAEAVRGCKGRLTRFLQRYLPLFYREEQRELAEVVIAGKLSNLQRKTSEPIAYAADRERKPVQHFVGAGKWDDDAVMAELRRHVAEEIGELDGVLISMAVVFPRKGPSRVVSAGNGVAAWARSTIVKSVSMWRTRRRRGMGLWIGVCICPRTGPLTRRVARSVMCPRRWCFRRNGGLLWTCWNAR